MLNSKVHKLTADVMLGLKLRWEICCYPSKTVLKTHKTAGTRKMISVEKMGTNQELTSNQQTVLQVKRYKIMIKLLVCFLFPLHV